MAQSESSPGIANLLARIQKAGNTPNIETDQAARATLLQLSRQLTASLEQPDEVVSNVAFSAGLSMCVRVAVDMQLFDLLAEKHQCTVQELAAPTGAEPALVKRVMRTLSGMGFASQVDPTTFAANKVTKQMTMRSVKAGIKFCYDEGLPILTHTPAYFRDNGYKLPQAMDDGAFQYAFDTKEDSFTYWSKKPGAMETFNTWMQGLFGTPARLGWTDWFPVKDVCLDGFDSTKGEYCFVDVGGGKGHEAGLVVKKYPDVQGKFVVQDFPFVINDITDLEERVERMPHDITQAQPVKGARTYFLQNILHNWASGVCQTILTHIKEAMIPGYSKLIIGNIVLPDQDVPLRASSLDIAMLFVHSGSERSQSEWKELIESVGLKLVKIWLPKGDGDGIIEAERPM